MWIVLNVFGCMSSFSSIEDYYQHELIAGAIEASEIEIFHGDRPPDVVGGVEVDWQAVDASEVFEVDVGKTGTSIFCFLEQTDGSEVEYTENVTPEKWGGMVEFSGYISGDVDNFTCAASFVSEYSDCTVQQANILSGNIDGANIIGFESLAIVVDIISCHQTEISNTIGEWVLSDALAQSYVDDCWPQN
jgi:hypothetical protein